MKGKRAILIFFIVLVVISIVLAQKKKKKNKRTKPFDDKALETLPEHLREQAKKAIIAASKKLLKKGSKDDVIILNLMDDDEPKSSFLSTLTNYVDPSPIHHHTRDSVTSKTFGAQQVEVSSTMKKTPPHNPPTFEGPKDSIITDAEAKLLSMKKRFYLEKYKHENIFEPTQTSSQQQQLYLAKLYLEQDGSTSNETPKQLTDEETEAASDVEATLQNITVDKRDVEKAISIYHNVSRTHERDHTALYNLGVIHKTNSFDRFNLTKSKMYFALSALKGNSHAQFEMGLLYANGAIDHFDDLQTVKNYMVDHWDLSDQTSFNYKIYKSLPQQQHSFDPESISIMHYFASALQGNPNANIALGYRHLYGYGVPKSCKSASIYYRNAADKIQSEFQLGTVPMIDKIRLSDSQHSNQPKQTQEDVMDYYQYSADKGSASSQIILGYANMYGLRGMPQNIQLARQYFVRAAEAGEPEAFAALGNLYARGIGGIAQNNKTAFEYFEKGTRKKDAASMNGLGYMYLHGSTPSPSSIDGYRLEKNYSLAAHYFNKSAVMGNSEAQYNLGLMMLTGIGVNRNYQMALQYMTLSAHQGQIMARYQLGVIYQQGLGVPVDCEVSVKFFKNVVERAGWTMGMELAHERYSTGDDLDAVIALMLYQEMAEQGLEVAQSNAAYMLEKNVGDYNSNVYLHSQQDLIKRALFWHKRAAEQGNVDAYVKVGDHHYYSNQEYEKSIFNYRRATELRNPQAMFNLGYMHEWGQGLTQDFHLAKRYYDMAAETEPLANVPVMMALVGMYVHWGALSLYHHVYGGQLTSGSLWSLIKGTNVVASSSSPPSASVVDGGGSELVGDDKLLGSVTNSIWQFIWRNEDVVLTALLGLLALLLLVRYVFKNTERAAREQRRLRREALARQLIREAEQQQQQQQQQVNM
ncbi:SEL1L [Acrasis kona]|uniref:SEL1L n=1 Tax=Acrasis kona TaxID=1008807 RepID=A0AAW2Z558_9EUKA